MVYSNCRTLPGSPLEPVEAAIVAAVNDPAVKVIGMNGGPPRPPAPPLTPQMMAEDIGVPFHPGAAKFYAENSITVKAR